MSSITAEKKVSPSPALAARTRHKKKGGRRGKSSAGMSWCFLKCNCQSSVAFTGIVVQANEDESSLFILHRHAGCKSVCVCVGEKMCLTDSHHCGWRRTSLLWFY